MNKKLSKAQRRALIRMYTNHPLETVVHRGTLKSLIAKGLASYCSTDFGHTMGALSHDGIVMVEGMLEAGKRMRWLLAFSNNDVTTALRKGEILETLAVEGEYLRFDDATDKDLCRELEEAGLTSGLTWTPGERYYRISDTGRGILEVGDAS